MLSSIFHTRSLIRRNRNPIPFKGWDPITGRNPKECKTALEAVQCIKSNDRVFITEVAASPHELLKALDLRHTELQNVELTGIFPTGIEPLLVDDESHNKAFTANCHFIGPPSRKSVLRKNPHHCFVPMFLHEIPQHLSSPDFPIDVALVSLSPPDKEGYCSIGPSVCCGRAGTDAAKVIVAEINPNIPYTLGNTKVHWSHLDYVFHTNRQIPQFPMQKITPEQASIGKFIAELVPDGACLQAGYGGVPDAVLNALKNHKHLGVHTEMFAEGLIDLIKSGAVDNSQKTYFPGVVSVSFVTGTDRLYKEISNNPLYHFEPVSVTNDPHNIAKNKNVISINSALQVDLSGQVCADSMGPLQFSGVGGQVDFVRGASLSEGGRTFICLPSTASRGQVSRITSKLTLGSSVTTARWHGPTIVTEFGIAELWGLNTRQRAAALINIAHPKFREQLAKEAAELYGTQ